jgi:hypothetical protein
MNNLNDDICDILTDAIFHTRVAQVYLAGNLITRVRARQRATLRSFFSCGLSASIQRYNRLPFSSQFSYTHRLPRRGRETLSSCCPAGATTKTRRYRGCRLLSSFSWTPGLARYRLTLQGLQLCTLWLHRRRRRFEGECRRWLSGSQKQCP